jgi:hypothetical protein
MEVGEGLKPRKRICGRAELQDRVVIKINCKILDCHMSDSFRHLSRMSGCHLAAKNFHGYQMFGSHNFDIPFRLNRMSGCPPAAKNFPDYQMFDFHIAERSAHYCKMFDCRTVGKPEHSRNQTN